MDDSPIRVVLADLQAAADAAAVLELLDLYSQDPMGDGKPLDEKVRRELIPAMQRLPTTRAYLALAGGQAVALALCFVGFSSFKARPLLNIHDFAVRPGWQGRGVGRLLMDEVVRAAAAEGCCKITLEVRADNHRARRLYLASGFEAGEPGSSEMAFWTKHL